MKQSHPPLGTCTNFLNNFSRDYDLIFDDKNYGLIANFVDKKTGKIKTQIAFKHYEVFSKQIPDIQRRWLEYVAQNDKDYFKELCDYSSKKAASIVRGDYRLIEHLKNAGFISKNEDNTDKTLD